MNHRPADSVALLDCVGAILVNGKPSSWVGFHTFRHTCATMLFRKGLNAKQVQMWLGHNSPAFTLVTYVHLLPDDLPDPGFLDALTGGNNRGNQPHRDRPRSRGWGGAEIPGKLRDTEDGRGGR
jgi:hypothetical protein